MSWFKPRVPKSAVADFEREQLGCIVKARLFNVPAAQMIQELEKHGFMPLAREAQRAIENRTMRLTPRMYDGHGEPVTQC
jgi:hypothetical protein